MGDMAFTSNDILWIIGAFMAIYGVYKIWRAYVLKRTQEEAAIEELEKSNKIILQTLLALLNHNIDGNGVEGMKSIRKELENYLVK